MLRNSSPLFRLACVELGRFIVSSHTILEIQPDIDLSVSSASTSTYFVPASVIPISRSSEFGKLSANDLRDSNPDGLGCARGIRTAFLLEAGIAVIAYSVWHLWHVVHIAR